MAQFKPFLGYSVGSIAGVTFQKSGQGYSVRSKPLGVHPRTPLQTLRRSQCADRARRWSAVLTESQRISWNNLASGLTRYNRFGDPYTPSGYQVYNEISSNRLLAGDAAPESAPVTLDVSPLSFGEITDVAGGNSYIGGVWEPACAADERLFPFAFINFSPGVSYVSDRYSFFGVSPLGQEVDYEIAIPVAKGVLSSGRYVSVMMHRYSGSTGALSPGLRVDQGIE